MCRSRMSGSPDLAAAPPAQPSGLMKRDEWTAGAALLMAVFSGQPLEAQDFWGFRTEEPTLTLELIRPSFEGDDFGFLSGVANVAARLPTDDVVVVVEVPLARAGLQDPSGSSVTMGNPYVGVEGSSGSGTLVAGVRLPIGQEWGDDDVASGVGISTDVERGFSAFLVDRLGIDFGGRIRSSTEERPVSFGWRGTVSASIPTGDDDGDTEFFLASGVRTAYEQEEWWLAGEISGWWFVSAEDADFSEVSTFEFGVTAGVDLDAVRPALQVRFPLDDGLFFAPDFTVGLGVQWRVR